MNNWEVIHEMDNDDGTPACYARKFVTQGWWVTQFPDRWTAETKVKVFDEPEIMKVKDFKSAQGAIRWVETNHQNWTEKAWG